MNITITREREVNTAWLFDITIDQAAADPCRLELRLGWVDYNHWSPSGADAPQAVARAVVAFLVGNVPMNEIGPFLDAARIRRQFPKSDAVIPTLIQRD